MKKIYRLTLVSFSMFALYKNKDSLWKHSEITFIPQYYRTSNI